MVTDILLVASKVGLSGLRTTKQLIFWADGCDAKRGIVWTHAGKVFSRDEAGGKCDSAKQWTKFVSPEQPR